MPRFEIKVSVREEDWADNSAAMNSITICIEDTPEQSDLSAMGCTPDTPELSAMNSITIDTPELSAMNSITGDTPDLSAMNSITTDTPELARRRS